MSNVQPTESKKHRPLNVRERKFVKNMTSGMSQYEAAVKAGYSVRSAQAIASENLKKPIILSGMQKALEKVGLSDDRLADIIRQGLDANKIISANVISSDSEGMKDTNSMTKDFVEVPDWLARHKFTDTALKLKGSYPTEKVEVSGQMDIRSIQIVFNSDGVENE